MTITAWDLLAEKRATIAPSLRRQFWLPLRRLLKMFHVLPVAAAATVFFLLAFDGQLTEIYISYLEDVASAGFALAVFRFVAAAIGFALISAVLYEAHYQLSGPRINIIFSMNSEVGTGSRLRHVQDISATVIALAPWLGIAAGLLHTNASLTAVFNKIRDANTDPNTLQHVPTPSALAIAGALLALAAVMAWLAAAHLKSPSLQRAVMILNPLAAGLVFLLLVGLPTATLTKTMVITAIAAAAAVLVYYLVYYRVQIMRAYIFRAQVFREDSNFNRRQWQRIILFVWAVLPWVAALIFYFLWFGKTPTTNDNGINLAMIPVAACWVSALGLLIAALLYSVRDSGAARVWLYGTVCVLAAAGLLVFWLATAEQIVTLYRLAGPLSALALSLLFVISIFVLLALLSQRSNFPALTLSILVLIASATLPLPTGVSAGLISVLCLTLGVVAVVSRLLSAAALAVLLVAIVMINYFKSEVSPVALRGQSQVTDLNRQFNAWLSSRGVPLANGKPSSSPPDSCFAPTSAVTASGQSLQYPVYIIAVEGGGIYAASAGSMFLARLQDENPCFSDHVFAISAVSGGAIGSTVFQSLEHSRLSALLATGESAATLAAKANKPPEQTGGPIDTSQPCQPPAGIKPADFSLEAQVCRIIQGDHFSPLVGSIFPELLGFVSKGRAAELAASFQQSVAAENELAGVMLGAHYSGHWVTNSKAPALVLNATWVETGFRAAFAPFPLHAIDDSLYSFLDQNMPMNSDEDLIQAAVVSARFPFVLPPYSMQIGITTASHIPQRDQADRGTSDSVERWNFVDGGYSDSSGAATALAIYKALQSAAQARHVVLRVILLTSSDPRLEPNQINGTIFADIMGPMDAILSVRNGLANEAVARACDGVMGANPSGGRNEGSQNSCEDRANKIDSALQIVGIEDTTYGLSLGWKISQTTFAVISWMLGQPNLVDDAFCNGTNDTKGATNSQASATSQTNGQVIVNEQVVRRNSCVLLSVKEALAPRQL
jgi:hypothetical protein